MSIHLFDLDARWAALEELLLEAGGELTPETEAALAELIDGTPATLERAGFARQSLENRIQVAKDRINSLKVGIQQAEAAIARIDGALLPILKRLGKAQKFPEFTLSTRTSTRHDFALAEGAQIYELDSRFWRQAEPELNKSELKTALESGQLPKQIHHAENETTSVTLRRKAAKGEAAADAA